MQFKLWLESDLLPKFASWNSYGDLVVYVGNTKYTFFTRNAQIAKKAYTAGQHNPWQTIQRLKDAGYEVKKDQPKSSQLTLF